MYRGKTESIVLEAGKYWVGDPCYAFDDHEAWMRLLKSADFENVDMLEAEINDAGTLAFVASGTHHGDGVFYDQKMRSYPVDAGLIGVVRPEEADTSKPPAGMNLVEFDTPFSIEYEDGKIIIGHLTIDTRWQDDIDADDEL